MKQLIPMDEYGIFADGKDTARVSSLYVAKFFQKEQKLDCCCDIVGVKAVELREVDQNG